MDVSGTPVRLKAVHVMAPLAGETDQWRAGLRALQTWRTASRVTSRSLLAGDFNASPGHPGFRALAAGSTTRSRVAAAGWVRTWPFVGHACRPTSSSTTC